MRLNIAIRHLQLKQFRQLIAISEKGSISRAAEELSISQPALSRSIRGIEKDLSVKLINRGPQGAELTEFGETLVNYGKIIEFNIRFAAEEIDELRGNKEGEVKLGIGPLEGITVADSAIDRLLTKRPNAEISIVENDFDILSTKLLSGEIDIMLGPSQNEKTPGLNSETISKTQLVFAVRAEHPLARIDHISLETISKADWILPAPRARAYSLFNNIFIKQGFVPPKGPITMAPRPGAIALLKRRDLICMVHPKIIKRELDEGSIRVLPIDIKTLVLPLVLTTREFDKLGPACRDMISEIRHVCQQMTID